MKNCGIYLIENKINNLVYVGQSVDIMTRWANHKSSAKSNRQDSYTKIHTAMKDFGIENFTLKILEECPYEELDEKEKYWISYYDSYNNGYNMTKGGESLKGEENPRAILTLPQVEEIRMAYNNKIPFRDVYKKYKHIISKRGLQKVWRYETWLHVLPEVYTEENRIWHSTKAKSNEDGNVKMGRNNVERCCQEDEILKMKELRTKGWSYARIAEFLNRSSSTVRKYCLFQEIENQPKQSKRSIRVKNLETGLVFDSIAQASKWANFNRRQFSLNLLKNKEAGMVPSTGEPAHWKKI